MWVARYTTMATLLEIGLEFGGRHHTTVMQAIRVIDHIMTMRPEFAAEVWAAVQEIDSVESVGMRRALIRLVA
jgi:chromosomal replication initiation ATPase DnaA